MYTDLFSLQKQIIRAFQYLLENLYWLTNILLLSSSFIGSRNIYSVQLPGSEDTMVTNFNGISMIRVTYDLLGEFLHDRAGEGCS